MLIFVPKYVQIRRYYLNVSLVNVQCAINWFQHMRDLCKNAVQKCLFELHVVLLFLFTVDWHNCDLWYRIHAKSYFEVLSDTQNQKNFWNSGQNNLWSSQLQEKKKLWQQFSVAFLCAFFPCKIWDQRAISQKKLTLCVSHSLCELFSTY